MDEQDNKSAIPAGLAGMAVYEGLPIVMAPLLSDAPHGLAKLVMSGKPIEAEFGTPISRLAEFTRSEVKAIQDFAKKHGVTAPIVAAGRRRESGYFTDRDGPLRRLLAPALGDSSDVVPHIALQRSSVPHALHEIGHATPIAGSHAARRALLSLRRTLGQN